MKKRSRYIKNEDGSKKSVLRFRPYYDEEMDMEIEPCSKRRKEKGKRSYRERPVKDYFLEKEH